MVFTGWNNHVLKRFCGDNAPIEWVDLVTLTKDLIGDRFIDKVELTSFVAKGHRTARWLLLPTDPEYCTKDEALKVAKELMFLILNSKNSVGITSELEPVFPEAQYPRQITKCPLCKKELDISDFDIDAREELEGLQLGHDIPISMQLNSHNANNIFWIHRRCNYIKGEQTLKQALSSLAGIIKNQFD